MSAARPFRLRVDRVRVLYVCGHAGRGRVYRSGDGGAAEAGPSPTTLPGTAERRGAHKVLLLYAVYIRAARRELLIVKRKKEPFRGRERNVTATAGQRVVDTRDRKRTWPVNVHGEFNFAGTPTAPSSVSLPNFIDRTGFFFFCHFHCPVIRCRQ